MGSDAAREEVVVCRTQRGQIEVSCHGGKAAVARIAADLAACGGVERNWREHLWDEEENVLKAEARIALAEALSERAGLILLDQYQGALSRAFARVADLLGQGECDQTLRELDELLATADIGLHLTRPWRVVLAGRPNAGKSSLMNALVGYERSIVYRERGTTRDVLSALTAFDGWPVELVDTAGIRAAESPIEQAGVARAEEQVATADLVLWTVAADEPAADLPPSAGRVLRVRSKCDLMTEGRRSSAAGIATSAKTGLGVAELGQAIAVALVPRVPAPGEPLLFTARQIQATKNLRDRVDRGDWELAVVELNRLRGSS